MAKESDSNLHLNPCQGKSPCLGCPDRSVDPNCHDGCQRYAKFAEYLAEVNEKRRKAERYDNDKFQIKRRK